MIRVNATQLFIFRLRNKKELDSVIEELGALADPKVLLEIYHTATAEDFNFLSSCLRIGFLGWSCWCGVSLKFVRVGLSILLGCGVGPVPFRIDSVESRTSWEISWASSEIPGRHTVEP